MMGLLQLYWVHKGAVGVLTCPAWLLICQAEPSALPPGGVGTIYGMMAAAIVFLVREVRAERDRSAALHAKVEQTLADWRQSETDRLIEKTKEKL